MDSTAYTALDPDRVSLLEISSGTYAGKKCAAVYESEATINGIPLGPENKWDVPTFVRVLESFFPNKQFPSGEDGWDTIVPPPDGPGGYEGAVPLGVVPNTLNPPPAASPSAWVLTSPLGNLSGESSERWYKFTGEKNRRYLLGATGVSAVSGISIKVEYFRSDGERPLNPVIKEVTSAGWDALDRGIWLDSPVDNPDPLYFLRISHSGGNAETSLNYTLKLHQAAKDPAVGTVTNPYYNDVILGKWTMNAEAAKAAALQNNKPLIFHFTGVRWCPYCVGTEHTAFATTAFNTALNDAYLVLVDNLRRNDTGPSLLRENFAGGYLTKNGITTQEADAKLAANLLLQNSLALPGASEIGWDHGPRIGYPTFVYCRVQAGAIRSGAEILPIGRFSFNNVFLPDAADAVTKIAQLKTLDTKGYRESRMFAEISQQNLDDEESPFSSYIGGVVSADWVKFTVEAGKSFLATIKAQAASAESEVDIKVYKEDGKTLLKRITGKLQDGSPNLEFMPGNSSGGTFWLCVSAVNQNTPVLYQLIFEQKQLKNQVYCAQTEIPIARSETSVTLTINRSLLMPDKSEPFSMQYRVAPGTASAGWFDSVNTWQNLDWTEDEKAQGKKELTLNFNVPPDAEPRPVGYWDFRVEIQVTGGENTWEISQNSVAGALVKIYSKAVFALDPDLRTLQLYVGIPFKLVIPICQGGDYDTPGVSGVFPDGVYIYFPTGEDPYLEGTPTSTGDEQPTTVEITLQLKNDGQETDCLTLVFSVIEMNNDFVDNDEFVGFLHFENQDITNPVGSLNLSKGADGTFTATVISKDSIEPVAFELPGWSYDPQAEELLLEFPETDGNSLSLRLSADGEGTGSFRSLDGEYSLSFFPATAIPSEYDGYYTVALRFPNPDYDNAENFALGWLLLYIDEDGKVSYSGEMEDGTTFSGETWVYNQENDSWGTVVFFAHLDGEEVRSDSGYLAGLLAVAPKSLRNPEKSNEACIMDCGNTSFWVKTNGENEERKELLPCGTVYDSTKTLQQQIGETDEFFYVETLFPADNTTLVPNRVKLQEAGNFLNNASPANAFGTQYSALQKSADGVFSGTVDLLVPGQGDEPFVTQTVAVRGVLTPVTSDCCSIGSDLYVGYGYYRWNEQVFSIRLSSIELAVPQIPDTPELRELGGQTKEPFNYLFVNDVSTTISKPAEWLLYRNNAAGASWSSVVSEDEEVDVLLDPAFTWQFIAVDANMAKSGILEIPLRKATVVQTFNLTGGDGAVQLQVGWNLIAVPWKVKPAADAALPVGLFSYDPQRKVFMPAIEFTTGSAYWLFVKDGFAGFSLLGETDASAVVPELAAGSWHFLAWHDKESILPHNWRWDGEKFIYVFWPTPTNPTELPNPTDGVWGYKEPVQ